MNNTFLNRSAIMAAANTGHTEKTIFLDMTASQLAALGIGIAVGGTLCYLAYRHYRKKVTAKEEKKNYKSFEELMAQCEFIDVLNFGNIKDWFDSNHVERDNIKWMIAFPSEELLNSVGYTLNGSPNPNKMVVMSVYDSKNGTVYKLRFVIYENIESNLHSKLLEDNGLVIIDA